MRGEVAPVAYEERGEVIRAALAAWTVPIGGGDVRRVVEWHGFHRELCDDRWLRAEGVRCEERSSLGRSYALDPDYLIEPSHRDQVREATRVSKRVLTSPAARQAASLGLPLPQRLCPLLWLDTGKFGIAEIYGSRPPPVLPEEMAAVLRSEAWQTGSPYENLGDAESTRLRPRPGVKLWLVADAVFNLVWVMWIVITTDDGDLRQILMRGPIPASQPVEFVVLPE